SNSSSVTEVNQLLLLSSSLIYKSAIVPADVFQMPVHRKALSLAETILFTFDVCKTITNVIKCT
ncbi:MAG: hypothetical protein ABIN93_19625, partial [Ginsengibacter sp.]